MVPKDEKKARDSGLITPKQAFDDTAENNRRMDKITTEPEISSDTSSLYKDYKDDQEMYSQENVNIEPYTIADKITDRDIQSQISTEKVSSIKEREKAHTSTKDRKILTKRDMIPIYEKKARDSGLIISKQTFDDTTEYNTIMDNISDDAVILSDTSLFYEDYKDDQKKYSAENANIAPKTIVDKITASDIQSQTSTKQIRSIEERQKVHTSIIDRMLSTKIDMKSLYDKKAIDSGLITSKQAIDDTAKYNTIMDNISDEPVVSSDTSSFHEDYKDDQERHSQENVNIEPHTIADKITDRDIQSQTSTERVSSIKEREKAHTSTKDRKILTTRDNEPTDEKKARDSRLITSKQAVDDTAEYNRKMDKITDEPVVSSDTSSLYDRYKGDQERYSEQIRSIEERPKVHSSIIDRMLSTKIDMKSLYDKKAIDSGLITSKQAIHDTAKYNTIMDNISDEPVVSSDTSSFHEDYKDDQERHSQENVNIEPHNIADKITDRDIQSQTFTERVSSIKEREKAHTSTKDRKISTTRDNEPTDEKRARDSRLITSKQAVDDTAEYNRKMDKITDEPVISSVTSSLYEHYKDDQESTIMDNISDHPVIRSDTSLFYEDYKDDQKRYSAENANIAPSTIADKITDSDVQSETPTQQIRSIKERQKVHSSAIDRMISKEIDMEPLYDKKARASGLITSKQAVDDTAEYKTIMDNISDEPVVSSAAEYNRKMDKITDEPVVSSDTSSLYERYKDDQERYSEVNVNIEPHIIAGKIPDSENQFKTFTEQITSSKEREKAHTSTIDRKILTKRDMIPIYEKKARDSGLIISKQTFDDTTEYSTIMDNISDHPVILSDTSLFYEDYKDDQKRYSLKNATIVPRTVVDKITDSDIQSQTSTKQIRSIEERQKVHTSTIDRMVSTKIDMDPLYDKKARDSGLITSKQAFDDTAEYNRKMDKITDEPVISSDTSSLYEDYKDDQERYSQENVNIEHYTITDKTTDSHSQTSTEQITSMKEREKAHATTIDRKILMKGDMQIWGSSGTGQ
ncbi:extracellular matrix-binding protein EbhA-like [Mytilus californianus]|uniref:extracellular matrix-binding protein EbhA-like n=1 Tax=Mytilus californianus TaxID=6549 RepID=UPI002246BBAB|nr:extracellular matrix-binding protein EbhA-like [Mytilus californianus]